MCKLEDFKNAQRHIFEDFSPSDKAQEERDEAFIMSHQTKTRKINHPTKRHEKDKIGHSLCRMDTQF
jgi:hypothetical protein